MATNGAIINHLGLVRVRIEGIGDLKITAISYNNAKMKTSPDIVMELSPSKIPTTLSNFRQQKMQIEFRTIEEGDYLKIGDIIPFIKPVATSYPQS